MSLDTLHILHSPISVGEKNYVEMIDMGYSNCIVRVEIMMVQDYGSSLINLPSRLHINIFLKLKHSPYIKSSIRHNNHPH